MSFLDCVKITSIESKGDMMQNRKHLDSFIKMFFLLIIACILGMFIQRLNSSDTNIVLIFLLAVFMTARVSEGYGYGLLASIIATFLFNYFFTAPYYTLSVYDSRYIITFIVMTVVSIITSASTTRIQKATLVAKENVYHMTVLYHLTSELSDVLDLKSLVETVINRLSDFFHCSIGLAYFNNEKTVVFYGNHQQISEKKDWDVYRYQQQLVQENVLKVSDQQHDYYALKGSNQLLGILIFSQTDIFLDENKQKVLLSMIESISLTLNRIYAVNEQLRLKEVTVKERYRGNLLRAISHDLRTPLSGIIGTSEMIMGINSENTETYNLAKGIYEEADWLSLLVENILSLTKVQEGKLEIHKQLEAIEEVIGSAVHHVSKNDKNYEINVHVPDKVLMVPLDAQLIQQVMINLLDNAMKNTQNIKRIDISAFRKDDLAYVIIEDYGKGFEQNLEKIFEMFYTYNGTSHIDGYKGVGLGLTICKAIVEAHGGTIEAKNCQTHQGAQFMICLPLKEII